MTTVMPEELTDMFTIEELDFDVECELNREGPHSADFIITTKCCGRKGFLCAHHLDDLVRCFYQETPLFLRILGVNIDLACKECGAGLDHCKTFQDWIDVVPIKGE